jgi:NTE family protein
MPDTPQLNSNPDFGTRLPSAAAIWSSGANAVEAPQNPDLGRWISPEPVSDKASDADAKVLVRSQSWPPSRLSLALQGGGSFGAFTWGVLDRLLEEPAIEFDHISGASAGAVNAVLLACGLIEGGREGARAKLGKFWKRMMDDASLLSYMSMLGFPHSDSLGMLSKAFAPNQVNPFDINPLRRALKLEVDFSTLRDPDCPRLLVATTRVRDGQLRIFRNHEISADAVLASTCLPAIHRAVEIDGEAYWDGAYVCNPPVLQLAHESNAASLLIVQVTPANDTRVPTTSVDIDRRLDQIMFNSSLNTELAALDLARKNHPSPKLLALQISRIAAENEIDGLIQRSAGDLGRGFVSLLHRSGRRAADQWISQAPEADLYLH